MELNLGLKGGRSEEIFRKEFMFRNFIYLSNTMRYLYENIFFIFLTRLTE
jgi:hypothetical protein